uniref:Uncharacterized protein n=1 Tax=Arundo donax TaxID=35708 RepID=A0A0A9HGW1_ARUDO
MGKTLQIVVRLRSSGGSCTSPSTILSRTSKWTVRPRTITLGNSKLGRVSNSGGSCLLMRLLCSETMTEVGDGGDDVDRCSCCRP